MLYSYNLIVVERNFKGAVPVEQDTEVAVEAGTAAAADDVTKVLLMRCVETSIVPHVFVVVVLSSASYSPHLGGWVLCDM